MGEVGVPRVLGRYALHAEIAAGGMASVHLGRLLGPVGFSRTVAIKRLHPQFARDPEFVAMFLDEARIAARIRHPNVVPTLDVVASEGEIFLVMEYVEGESLARLVRASRRRGGPPPPRIVAAILSNALLGLHAAHEAKNEQGQPLGLVHRDISPQNLLVGTDGITRVVDFGIAKAIGRSQVTREGQLKGKLPYMAPEQVRRGGAVTARTDVYAASVVLWEALTARRLFEGDEEAHILAAVLEGHVDPPSVFEPTLPKALDEVVMRGLAQDPTLRFGTAREMAQALEASVLPASATEVGEWVSATADDGLTDRARLVRAVEGSGDGSGTTPAPAAPPSHPAAASQVSSISVATPSEGRQRGRRRALLGVGAVALVLVAAVTLVVTLGRMREPTSTTAATATGAKEPTANDAAPSFVANAPSSTASQLASASAVASPSPSPSGSAKPARPAFGARCVPPYYYEKGIKRFKPECL